jgi:hypothetical protein
MTTLETLSTISNLCLENPKIDCVIVRGMGDMTPMRAIAYLIDETFPEYGNWEWEYQNANQTTILIYNTKK